MNRNIFRLYGNINRDLKENPEVFNTGLVGEALIVASYKQMTIEQLEKLRYIINRIVQIKKGYKKANENTDTARDQPDGGHHDSGFCADVDRPADADK